MGIKISDHINLADASGVSGVMLVGSYSYMGVTLQPDPDQSYSLGSAESTVQYSADGENFTNSTSVLSASTLGKFNLDIRGVHSIRLLTTTADGAADPSAGISVYLQ